MNRPKLVREIYAELRSELGPASTGSDLLMAATSIAARPISATGPRPGTPEAVRTVHEKTMDTVREPSDTCTETVYGLETSERPSELLDECYRVLGPGGQAAFVVPNRSGLWARSEKTPFGYGRPYSLSQLDAQLKRHDFVPEKHISVLYQPPSTRRFWMRTGPFWEHHTHAERTANLQQHHASRRSERRRAQSLLGSNLFADTSEEAKDSGLVAVLDVMIIACSWKKS